MNLLKLTIANGPEKDGALYVNKDKICGFSPIICRLGPDYGKEKGANILLDNHYAYSVVESIKDICEMLGKSEGYLEITSAPRKNEI